MSRDFQNERYDRFYLEHPVIVEANRIINEKQKEYVQNVKEKFNRAFKLMAK